MDISLWPKNEELASFTVGIGLDGLHPLAKGRSEVMHTRKVREVSFKWQDMRSRTIKFF